MVGIPSFGNAETIGYVVRAATAGMVQYFPELKPILVNSDGGSPDDTPRVAVSTESPDYLEKVILVSPKHKLQRISFTYHGTSGKGTAVRALYRVQYGIDGPVHLVFCDRHGIYCEEHGRGCPAVFDAVPDPNSLA